MNFTEADRKFIRKIATSNDELQKRVTALEKKSLAKALHVAEDYVPDTIRDKVAANTIDLELPGNDMSSVNVTFKHPDDVSGEQKAFIISLYKTLHELCAEHDVESLQIVIKAI